MQNNWQIPKYHIRFDKLLSEISHTELDNTKILNFLENNKDPEKYPFDNIFKGKWRLFFPLVPPKVDKSLVELYEKTIEFVNRKVNNTKINWENLSITYDYSSERGTQKREESLIKFLRKKQFPEQGLKILSDKSKLFSNIEKVNKYIVCFSRHPIDVLRMSDHDGWTSCHSPHRNFFKDAIDEAKGNGPIAYLVKKEDVHSFGADFIINNPEIFKDKKRNIDGIIPVSRLRMRRYNKSSKLVVGHKNNFEIAIPDMSIYGDDSIPFFYENVAEFAAKMQEEELKNPELFSNSNGLPTLNIGLLDRFGGNYQDPGNSDQEIFEKFYDDYVFPEKSKELQRYAGSAQYKVSDNSKDFISEIDILKREVEQVCDRLNRAWGDGLECYAEIKESRQLDDTPGVVINDLCIKNCVEWLTELINFRGIKAPMFRKHETARFIEYVLDAKGIDLNKLVEEQYNTPIVKTMRSLDLHNKYKAEYMVQDIWDRFCENFESSVNSILRRNRRKINELFINYFLSIMPLSEELKQELDNSAVHFVEEVFIFYTYTGAFIKFELSERITRYVGYNCGVVFPNMEYSNSNEISIDSAEQAEDFRYLLTQRFLEFGQIFAMLTRNIMKLITDNIFSELAGESLQLLKVNEEIPNAK